MSSHRRTRLGSSKFELGVRSRRAALLAATALSICSSSGAFAAEDSTNEALLKKLDKLEQRIHVLEGELKQKDSPPQADAGTRSSSRPASIRSANATASSTDAKGVTDAEQEKKGAKGKPEAQSAETSGKPMLDLPPLPAAGDKPILGLADSPVPGLSIGAYGEVKFGAVQNPAAKGQWQDGFDAQRFVLLPTYAITPNII